MCHLNWIDFCPLQRRNTLHGYKLKNINKFRDFLAIHDGALPFRLPEWGRYMLIALLADPSVLLGGYAALKN